MSNFMARRQLITDLINTLLLTILKLTVCVFERPPLIDSECVFQAIAQECDDDATCGCDASEEAVVVVVVGVVKSIKASLT